MQTNKTAEAFLEWQLTDRGAACSAVDTLTGKDAQKYLGNRLREAFYAGAALNQPAGEPVAHMWTALKDGEVITQYGEHCPQLFRKSCRPLYTHPTPAQACKVPEKKPMRPYQTVNTESTNYKAGWNACIKAMLAAAPEVDNAEGQQA